MLTKLDVLPGSRAVGTCLPTVHPLSLRHIQNFYQTAFCLAVFIVLLSVESAACRSPAFNPAPLCLPTSISLSRSSRVSPFFFFISFFCFFYTHPANLPHFCKHTSASCVVTLDSGRLLFCGEAACVRAAGPFFSLRTLKV